jgi:LL-diaminopimelate aminotransferase
MSRRDPVARRIRELPPYLFAQIDRLKREALAAGADLIDLGVGDPDLPTPPHVVAALQQAAAKPAYHRYPAYPGMHAFRRAAARFMERRFGVRLDAEREVIALIGSKEGIAHLPLALVDPGDEVLCPDPGYPVYAAGTLFSGGVVRTLPLRREAGFLPELPGRGAKLVWVNYPNNPTAATATLDFYRRLAGWARSTGTIVASDLAYSEMVFEGDAAPSFLQAGADLGIEFHSLSKTFNMTGWRIGWACGRADLIAALGSVKTNVDSGAFEAVQEAAVAALEGDPSCVARMREVYRARRDALCDGLSRLGYDVIRPQATFYVLCACPPGLDSLGFCAQLLERAHLVGTPAVGFGAGGEGYVRFALTQPVERIREAVERIARL